MSLIKKLAKETAIYGISSILSKVVNYFFLAIYLTRYMTTFEYGIYNDVYAMAAILIILFTYRMETAFFRFVTKGNNIETVFSTASISIIITTVIFVSTLIIFSGDIAALIEYPDKKEYIIYFAFIIGLDALSAIPFARLRLENRPIKFAVLKILNVIINVLLVFFFLNICPMLVEQGNTFVSSFYNDTLKLDFVFLSNFVASFVVFILLTPALLKSNRIFDRALLKQMLIYGWPLILVGIAGVINQSGAILVQKYFLSGDIVANLKVGGVYAASAKIAILMNLFTFAFNYAAEPFFFSHAERSDSKQIYAQVAQAFTMVSCFVFLGILLYLDLIQLIIGKNFRGGIEVVPILLMAYLFLGLYYNFSIWYKLTDRTIIGAYISVSAAAITLLINIVFLPQIGYMASAWAALACYIFMALAGYILGKKYYPIPYPIFRMFGYIVLSISLYFLSELIRANLDSNMWMILGVNTIIMFTFLGVIYSLEKRMIQEIIS